MRFSVLTLFDFFPALQNEVRYYQDTLNLMIRADTLGFDSVWVGEEHFYTIGICPSPQLFLTALPPLDFALSSALILSLLGARSLRPSPTRALTEVTAVG